MDKSHLDKGTFLDSHGIIRYEIIFCNHLHLVLGSKMIVLIFSAQTFQVWISDQKSNLPKSHMTKSHWKPRLLTKVFFSWLQVFQVGKCAKISRRNAVKSIDLKRISYCWIMFCWSLHFGKVLGITWNKHSTLHEISTYPQHSTCLQQQCHVNR